jgi:tetratricopeptide (TPR) repeat protein
MRSWMLGLCFVLVAAPAHADDKAKAKQLYDEGLRHFQVAEYPQAIDAWKQSYLLSKAPLLLFNIGQAYRLSGDCKQAMTFYDNYTDAAPAPKNQDELDQAVAACKDKVDKPANPTTNPTTATTTTTTTTAPTGTQTETKPVETKPVETKPVETKPTETTGAVPPIEQPPPTEASGGHRKLAIGLTVAGGVLEAGAVYFALDGRSKMRDVQNASAWDQSAKDAQAAGQRDNKLAIGFAVAGGAALVAGAVLIFTGGHSAETGVAIVPAPDGARVGWSHSF